MNPIILSLMIAADSAVIPINPRAAEFIDREPVVKQWALAKYDTNHDGWLTMFEAQDAVAAFKAIADVDHDGRVSVREYADALTYVKVRY